MLFHELLQRQFGVRLTAYASFCNAYCWETMAFPVAAGVATEMTEGRFNHDRCLQTADVAEAVMLAVRTSSSCVPQEITLRLTLSAAL